MLSCRRAALAGGQTHSKKQFILLLKDELLAPAKWATVALFVDGMVTAWGAEAATRIPLAGTASTDSY